jgi:hypothetical protein
VPVPIRGIKAAACQGGRLRISCQNRRGTYLNVTSAFYGRDVTGVNPSPFGGCSKRGWDTTTQCGVDQTALWSSCNGYRSCYARVKDNNLGSSGCGLRVWKMAKVTYDCLPANAFTSKFGASFRPSEKERVVRKSRVST